MSGRKLTKKQRHALVAKHLAAIAEDEGVENLYSVGVRHHRPWTTVTIRYNPMGHIYIGTALVSWPDKYDPAVGFTLAFRRAVNEMVKDLGY